MEEHQEKCTVLPPLSAPPTLAAPEANAHSGSNSSWDEEHDAEEDPWHNSGRWQDPADRSGIPTQMFLGEPLGIEDGELEANEWLALSDGEWSPLESPSAAKASDEEIEHQPQENPLTLDEPADNPGRRARLGVQFGTALMRRFKRSGDLEDIDQAIRLLSEAALLASDRHEDKLSALNDLGMAHQSRFGHLGELADLDKAIEFKSQAVLLTPDGHPDKPDRLNNLGNSYASRFQRLGELADLAKAIDYQTQAVLLIPDGHAHKPSLLNNLGSSYEFRFERLGEPADADKAIDYQTESVLLTPNSHPDKPRWLNNLGVTYLARFDHLDVLTDLDKAIEYQTQAVILGPDGHPDKPSHLNHLGCSYESRFRRLGELADLDKAIELQTRAVFLTPDSHTDKPSWLNNLGVSYWSRFERVGDIADVDRAIEYPTQAVLLMADEDARKPNWLNNLGIAYVSRFDRFGELADLDQAIEYETQAVLLTPDGHANKANFLNNLGISYESRFQRGHDLADVDKAIEYKTRAMLLTPDQHANKPAILNNLGVAYDSRFTRLGELADLNKAIEYTTQGLTLTPDGHARRPVLLSNLGVSYKSRFNRVGELIDIDKAIEYFTQAAQLIPDGHADKPIRLDNLGGCHRSRFTHSGEYSDLECARTSFQSAAQLLVVHPEAQLKSARKWAQCSSLLGLSPRMAYERCIELIPYLVWLGAPIEQRYILLTKISDLAMEAAAWAISVNSHDLALEWLEEGRSVVWSQILQLRTPFDDLSLADPVLSQQLKDVATMLEGAGSRQATADLPINPSWDLEKDAQEHHHLAATWADLLEKARKIPGFHNFMRPRKASELKLATSDGPVVVINAHSTRCDALILFPECDDIAHLPLPQCSVTKLGEARVQLETLIGHRGERARGLKLSRPAPKLDYAFKSLLAALWSDIVQPVMDVLASSHNVSADQLPHVTWCTTGALSFLPLHAAGCYDGSQPNAFDLVVSSYTPTLSALITPSSPTTSLNIELLAVGQEHAPGLSSLPFTVSELEAIKACAVAIGFQQLNDRDGTVDAVLGAMDNCSWVHFACHATQNPINPALSAFHLHDGNLTLAAITKRAFKNKGLAFLSACQTATGDNKLPDEAVHLAAGMLMAGYPSVIATMWSIYDEDAPRVAGEVYAQLLKDGKMNYREAARALHKAVASLREKVGDDAFQRWVPFIHIGV